MRLVADRAEQLQPVALDDRDSAGVGPECLDALGQHHVDDLLRRQGAAKSAADVDQPGVAVREPLRVAPGLLELLHDAAEVSGRRSRLALLR